MAIRDPLQEIPGVGPRTSTVLRGLGIERVSDLVGADPAQLYERQCVIEGGYVDRCVLYVFRSAVYYASTELPEPDLLLWWNWKDRTELDGNGAAGRT